MGIITDRRGQTMLLIAVALGMFMDGLDGSIVNVALPEISRSLEIGTGTASWVVTVYFLIMAGLILIFGKICDSGAIKKIFILGFIIFSLSSLFCGISTGLEMLLFARALQGVGAAMLAASSLMLCVKYYPPIRMAFALSVGILGSSVGAAIGPALGGVITELISWHWIFIINVPIGLLAVLFAIKAVPKDEPMDKRSFDVIGSILLFAMLASSLYLLESYPSTGMNEFTLPLLALFIVTFVGFIIRECRYVSPVLSLRLFRSWNFDIILVSFVLMFIVLMGGLYLLPFYMSLGMGFDSMTCGLYLFIPSLITLFTCTYISKVSDRTERRIFVVIACALMAMFAAILAFIEPEMGIIPLLVALVLIGLVWGVSGGPAASRIVEAVPKDDSGSASSLLSFFIYFGSALGTVMFAAFFGMGSGQGSAEFSDLSLDVFMDGFHFAMIIGVILSILSIILAALVNEKKKAKGDGQHE